MAWLHGLDHKTPTWCHLQQMTITFIGYMCNGAQEKRHKAKKVRHNRRQGWKYFLERTMVKCVQSQVKNNENSVFFFNKTTGYKEKDII